MDKNKAMVLAAGLGTRLRPLTDLISKPMAPIVNRPVMEHIVRLLVKHNFTDIVCNLHWYPDEIRNYFGDGSRWGVNIVYSYEKKLLGTAGGVKNVEDFFEDNTFLVISGEAESNLANSGIYFFEPEIFSFMPCRGEFCDFGKNVFPGLLSKNIVYYGYRHNQYWNDVGGLDEYQQGNFDALEGKVNVSIPGEKIKEGVWAGKNCRIQEGVVIIPPVCIGDNCTIKKDAKLFGPIILGSNTIVDERAILYRGIKWGSGYIGKDASLIGAIIGYNTKIKDKASILEKAVIGSRSIIKDGIKIHPSVKIMSDKIIDIDTENTTES